MQATDYKLLYEATLVAKQELEHQHKLLGEEVRRLKATESTSALPDFIPAIGERLRTQHNRYTADPLFVVYEKREIVVNGDYDHDRLVWWNSDKEIQADERTAKRLECLEDADRLPDCWEKLAIKDIDVFVTACFTEQGCKDFLAINGHNLRQPFIYADGLFRNHEMLQLRDWIMRQGGAA